MSDPLTQKQKSAYRPRPLSAKTLLPVDAPFAAREPHAASQPEPASAHSPLSLKGLPLQLGVAAMVVMVAWLFTSVRFAHKFSDTRSQDQQQITQLQTERNTARAQAAQSQHEVDRQKAQTRATDLLLARMEDTYRAEKQRSTALDQALKNALQAQRQNPQDLLIPLRPTDIQAVTAAQKTGQIPIKIAPDLKSGNALVLGTGTFGPVRPVGTVVVSDRPVLAWNPFEGAADYEVVVSDLKGHRLAGTSKRVSHTEWMVDKPLVRGQTYVWQVIPYSEPGQNLSPSADAVARFQVLKKDEAVRATQYLDAQLQIGILYIQEGLLDDAEAALVAVVAADPSSSRAQKARSLLASIDKQRPKR